MVPDNVVDLHGTIDTPLLDAAGGEVRNVMAGLMDESDRRRLLDALDDLDRQLNTALELFYDAGFTPTRTARFLLNETRLDPDTVTAAMIADELEHHPLAPDVPADDRAQITADTQAAIAAVTRTASHEAPRDAIPNDEPRPHRSGPLDSLSDGDRYLLTHMDLTRADCLTEACRALHDAGLDIEHAHEVLTELDVDPDRVAAALNEKHYNPATGRPEALWAAPNQQGTARGPRAAQRRRPAAAGATAPRHPPSRRQRRTAPPRAAQRRLRPRSRPVDRTVGLRRAPHRPGRQGDHRHAPRRHPRRRRRPRRTLARRTRQLAGTHHHCDGARTCTDWHLSCDREAVDPDGPADAAQDPRTGDGVSTDDDLLCALDQLTNTVYWCRQRGMPTTAGSAILEAVGDWLDSQDPSPRRRAVCDRRCRPRRRPARRRVRPPRPTPPDARPPNGPRRA